MPVSSTVEGKRASLLVWRRLFFRKRHRAAKLGNATGLWSAASSDSKVYLATLIPVVGTDARPAFLARSPWTIAITGHFGEALSPALPKTGCLTNSFALSTYH